MAKDLAPRVPKGCSRVVLYGWGDHADRTGNQEIEALTYWPLSPGIRREGKQTFIVIPEWLREFADPNYEVLETGEARPMPRRGGSVYFNRSRRVAPVPFNPWKRSPDGEED